MVRFVGVHLGAALGDDFRRFPGGWDWLGMVRNVPGAAEPYRGRSEAVRASPNHPEKSKIIAQSRPKTDPYKTDYRTILTGRGKVGINFPGRGHWALPGGTPLRPSVIGFVTKAVHLHTGGHRRSSSKAARGTSMRPRGWRRGSRRYIEHHFQDPHGQVESPSTGLTSCSAKRVK